MDKCKKIFFLAITLILIAGCTNNEKKQADDSINFVEKEISISNFNSLSNVVKWNDKLLAVVEDEGNIQLLDSKDASDEWKIKNDISKLTGINYEKDLGIFLLSNGDLFITKFNNDLEAENILVMSETKEVKKIIKKISQKKILFVETIGDNVIILVDEDAKTYWFDMDKEELIRQQTLDIDVPTSISKIGENVFFVSPEGIQVYNVKNGDEVQQDKIAEQMISRLNEDAPVGNTGIALTKEGERKVYFNTQNKVYLSNNDKVEEVFDITNIKIKNPDTYFSNILPISEDKMLLYKINTQTNKGTVSLVKKEALSKEISEVSIWSLNNNFYLEAAINKFNSENNDIRVNYKVGNTDGTAQTDEDSIKKLNTELLAGSGPDILLLDGLPIDSYLEKGLLADISSIHNKVNTTEGLYENLTQVYKEDEKILAIPTRFTLLGAMGSNELGISTIKNLHELTNTIENSENKNLPIFADIIDTNSFNAAELADFLYFMSISKIVENNVINEKELKDLFEDSKKIYSKINKKFDNLNDKGYITDYSTTNYVNNERNEVSLNLEFMGALDQQYVAFKGLQKKYNKEVLTIFNTVDDSVFLPGTIIGLSTYSENDEFSKKVVESLLSSKYQLTENIVFHNSTNKKTMETLLTNEVSVGLEDTVLEKLTGLEIKEIGTLIAGAKQPINQDVVMKNIILEQLNEFIVKNVSLEECLQKATQTINLYLSE